MIGRLFRWAMLIMVIAAGTSAGVTTYVQQAYGGLAAASPRELPRSGAPRVAIVFGAGLWANGTPTPILYDRVATAVELYKLGAVRTLLMSGDDSTPGHDEPSAMVKSALSLGVPRAALVADGAGLRTYDTCMRARTVYGVSRAVVVTQQFHIARAIFTCSQLGIDTVGVDADRRDYRPESYAWWTLREYPSTLLAYLETNLLRPAVASGARQPLP
ncbi:MAG: YdcF family protein [Chloroflexi bacterium]|nr:YdcF family protein [Chloroflexota bacterium]